MVHLNRRQFAWFAIAAGLGLCALSLLSGNQWFNPLPMSPGSPEAPLSGATLFRILLAFDGVILISLGIWRPRLQKLAPTSRIASPVIEAPGQPDLSVRTSSILLVFVTLIGATLRLYGLDSELWLDEIIHRLIYGGSTLLEVMVSYSSSNNHLLNTWLTNISVATFGDHEWAIRLPALIFGVACVPVVYLLARRVLPRWPSLVASALLAVSYHHIFFTQNSRGYTAHLLFSMLATYYLIRGLDSDSKNMWLAYVLVTCANIVSLATAAFVFLAHMVISLGVLAQVRSQGGSPRHTAGRLVSVFAVACLGALHFYVAALPQMWVVMRTVYSQSHSGYRLFSAEFSAELNRGLASGFGPGLLVAALPLLAMASLGLWGIWTRNWILTSSCILPSILLSIFVIARDLTITPRFFLPLLIPTVLACARAIEGAVAWMRQSHRRGEQVAPAAAGLAVAAIMALSVFSLRDYYRTPKQPFRTSIEHLESTRRPDQIVIALHNARRGIRFYVGKMGLGSQDSYFYAPTRADLLNICQRQPDRPAILVTTFPRALRLSRPELKEAVDIGWQPFRRFRATVGDAQITLWEQKSPHSSCLQVLEATTPTDQR